MRARAAALLWLAAGGAAIQAQAQAQEHGRIQRYEDKWFSIQFPADPRISSGTYQAVTPSGAAAAVPATIYALKQGRTDYRVTVADLGGSPAQDAHALDHAVQAIRARGGLALDLPVSHSLSSSGVQLCGRQFGYESPAGRLNYLTLFYNGNTRLLYEIFSSVAAQDQAEHGAEVTHFQQSLALLADPASKAPPDYPPSWQVFEDKALGFSIRFPAAPTVEQASYRTEGGVTVPATRVSARQGDTLYRITAANLWQSEGDEGDVVEHAATAWKRQGELLSEETIAVSNGQCGRDISVAVPSGGQSRARIFFPSSQHRLYLIEVTRDDRAAAAPRAEDRYFLDSYVIARPE